MFRKTVLVSINKWILLGFLFIILMSISSFQSDVSTFEPNHPHQDLYLPTNALISKKISITNYLENNTTQKPNYIEPFSVKKDSAGNIFITGYYEVSASNIDVFVLKLKSDGSIIFKIHFGGSGVDLARALALDSNGNIYVTGYTNSPDFFMKNAFQSHFSGSYDIFLTKISPTGQIIFSTYLGSTGADFVRGIVINNLNQIILGCYSNSPINSKTDQLDFSKADTGDITPNFYPLIYKINENGTPITDHVYYENISYNTQGIALDQNSNIILIGGTFNGSKYGAFVKIISNDTLKIKKSFDLHYGTFSWGFSVAVDKNDNIWIGGITNALNVTAPNGTVYVHRGGKYDAFIARINSSLQIDKFVMLGGPGDDVLLGLTIDGYNNVVVTGRTDSETFLDINPSLIKKANNNLDGTNIFVSKVYSNGSIAYINLMGGESDDTAKSITFDSVTNSYLIVGSTRSIKEYNLPISMKNSLLLIKLNVNGSIITQQTFSYLFSSQPNLLSQIISFLFLPVSIVFCVILSAFLSMKILEFLKKKFTPVQKW